jgi:hypothetical protein
VNAFHVSNDEETGETLHVEGFFPFEYDHHPPPPQALIPGGRGLISLRCAACPRRRVTTPRRRTSCSKSFNKGQFAPPLVLCALAHMPCWCTPASLRVSS